MSPTNPSAQNSGYRWLPLGVEYAPKSWRVLKQAGRTPLILSALRNAPISFVRLPKLDVAGSSPVARSVKLRNKHLLNWPVDLGRPFYHPPTATGHGNRRGSAGYRCA